MSFEPDYRKAVLSPSPNYWEGREGFKPLFIVMHGTAGDVGPSLNWLCNPQSTASVHYVVDRSGKTFQLVREQDAAWGNGIPEEGSPFLGGPNPNYWSISVEHERNTDNTSSITPQQYAASVALVIDIRARWGHLPLIPHSLISPHSRVHCPGPGFPLAAIERDACAWECTGAPSVPPGPRPPLPAQHKVLIERTMMARSAPSKTAVIWTKGGPMWVYANAVLDATGKHSADGAWIEVTAGGRPVWVLGANTTPM